MGEDTWNALFSGRRFITDLGRSEEAEVEGVLTTVDRYAVWVPQGAGHQIVEVGPDLDERCRRYGIPERDVCSLVRR